MTEAEVYLFAAFGKMARVLTRFWRAIYDERDYHIFNRHHEQEDGFLGVLARATWDFFRSCTTADEPNFILSRVSPIFPELN